MTLLWAIELGIGVLESYRALEVSPKEMAEQTELLLRSTTHEQAKHGLAKRPRGSVDAARGGMDRSSAGHARFPRSTAHWPSGNKPVLCF